MWVRSRSQTRKLARGALRRELADKGIDAETAAGALDQLSDEDEEAAARELVERKLADPAGPGGPGRAGQGHAPARLHARPQGLPALAGVPDRRRGPRCRRRPSKHRAGTDRPRAGAPPAATAGAHRLNRYP